MVLFAIGTRVRLVHSGDEGTVTELLDDRMVNVQLRDSGLIIPAFLEDLERVEDLRRHKPTKARIVPGKQTPRAPAPPSFPEPEIQYNIIKSQGIQLAFDPVLLPDGSPREYRIFLINDMRSEWLYSFGLALRQRPLHQQNGKLQAVSYEDLGTLLFDQLNDAPVITLDCWRLTTEGSGPKQHRTLKIKPKTFFKRNATAPLLNRPVHLFLVFPPASSDTAKPNQAQEDIKSYTRRKVAPRSSATGQDWHEVLEKAEFIPELDLHIDQLVSNAKKLKPSEILRIQMQQFEQYLDKAIGLGVERVFIIHGVGKGRLRDAIATQLMRMQEVKSFKNEYHARYGYGATEVIFEE